MHTQKHKKIGRRIACLLSALVMCFALAVPSFAAMTSGLPLKVSNGGVIGAQFDNILYTYYLPENKPEQATGENYLCLICPSSIASLPYENYLLLIWFEFSSSDWSFTPSEAIQEDGNENICYKGSIGGSASYTVYYNNLLPNKANSEIWNVREQLAFPNLPFLTIVATSKRLETQGFLWASECTYRQGFNGAIQGSISGTPVAPGGQTIISPITPEINYEYVEGHGELYGLLFGVLDGFWSGFWQGYQILGNGITLYGLTLHNVIISILATLAILGCVILLVKVVFVK